MIRSKIFCGPGDHRDDFATISKQFDAWAAEARPQIEHVKMSVNPAADKGHQSRHLMTLLVLYRPVSQGER